MLKMTISTSVWVLPNIQQLGPLTKICSHITSTQKVTKIRFELHVTKCSAEISFYWLIQDIFLVYALLFLQVTAFQSFDKITIQKFVNISTRNHSKCLLLFYIPICPDHDRPKCLICQFVDIKMN